MRKSSFAALALVGSAALVGGVVTPAIAADTTSTVAVSGGTLTIGAPGTSVLTNITSSSSEQEATATLTDVSVIDDRASTAGWTASVALSAFTTPEGTPGSVIPPETAVYTPAAAVVTVSPTTVVTPTTATDLSTTKAVQSTVGGTSSNTATWDATLTVKVPALALANDYTATLTHSIL
jgi:hypothetical protein